METDSTQSPLHPKTLVELLPDIKGIITESALRTLTAKKQNRATANRTTERVYKPLTMAEMAVEINAMGNETLRALPTPSTNMSTRKKAWNTSIKVDKKFVNCNANTNPKLKPSKKILFRQTPDPLAMSFNQSRAISNRNIPKFPKPESYAKKALAVNRSNDVRISGVYKMPLTPKEASKQLKLIKDSSAKKSCSNKENCFKTSVVKPKKKLFVQEDTPLSIDSTGYDSFLQHEKDINDIVNKTDALNREVVKNTRTNSLSASTPFKEYRNFEECFDESSRLETSNIQMADTMINFVELPSSDENKKEDDALVPSLCDILEKITIKSVESADSLEDLVHLKELTLNTLKTLNKIRESEEAKLAKIDHLIALKENLLKKNEVVNTTKIETVSSEVKTKKEEVKESDVQPVIKSCLKPSYKLPRRNSLIKRKILFQHNSSTEETPKKGNVRAQTMYMNLKARLPYLSTPLGKKQNVQLRDTPAKISHNLQEQLDKLYNEKI